MPTPTAESKSVELITVIESQIKKLHTQSLDLSFNELLDMHKSREIDISPDYQRLFQWSPGARSRFIESLLLEMPVPPIYFVEEGDGKYSLIDGLQRLSSYLHLRGELEAPHLDPKVKLGEKLILQDCDIVPQLNEKTFDDLGPTLQIKLKRAFVRVEIVRKGSDPRYKYFMFKRLNTGGTLLSAQQLRNCTIRLLDPKFNDFIIELSKAEDFVSTTEGVTQQNRLAAFDQELVLRFFALKNNRPQFKHDVADFLTEYMELVSDPERKHVFDYAKEKEVFSKTFAVLNNALAEQAFSYANKTGNKLNRGFGVYHYEAITLGIQQRLASLDPRNRDEMTKLGEFLRGVKLDPAFVEITTGGGKNSPGPLNERITFVEKKLQGF